MDILQDIVRSVALIILFAGFMEMLLPDTEMRRYIQVVVGLFVVVSLVTPLITLIHKEKNFAVASWQYIPEDNTKKVIENGKKIAQQQQEKIESEADKRIATQINALTKLHAGVKEAEVKIEKNPQDGLVRVKIKLTTDKSLSAKNKSELSKQVSDTITAFFDYSTENIEIAF